MDAGDGGAGTRAGARESLRLLLRPPPRRPHPPEALRRPVPRPHDSQGRSHGHRDHEPSHRAGVDAPVHPGPRGAPRGGASPRRRRPRGRGPPPRHPARRLPRRPRPGHAARHGRRAHDVQGHRVLRRQGGRRHRARPEGGGAPPGHGDGAIPPHGARRAQLTHDWGAPRGGSARRGRPPAQRHGRALHGPLRPHADGALHPRSRRARVLHRGPGGTGQPQRRSLDRRLAPRREDRGGQFPRHGPALPRLRSRSRARAGRGRAHRALHDGRRGDRSLLSHERRGPLRGGRGYGRHPRRQPPRGQRRGRLHRVRWPGR